jgi:hypothetical protein
MFLAPLILPRGRCRKPNDFVTLDLSDYREFQLAFQLDQVTCPKQYRSPRLPSESVMFDFQFVEESGNGYFLRPRIPLRIIGRLS